MANFLISFEKTLQFEGGYSNVSSDRGGRTYKGISEKNFPGWEGWVIINKLEPLSQGAFINNPSLDQMVQSFYQSNFWNPIKLSNITVQDIADELFDTAVNMGVGTAGKMIQRAMNLLNRNRNQKSFSDLAVDGVVGGGTLATVNSFINTDANVKILLKTLNAIQGARYISICEADTSQEVNFIGWLKRI